MIKQHSSRIQKASRFSRCPYPLTDRPEKKGADTERMAELDEMIAHGWGSTPARDIPENWRETKPAYKRAE